MLLDTVSERKRLIVQKKHSAIHFPDKFRVVQYDSRFIDSSVSSRPPEEPYGEQLSGRPSNLEKLIESDLRILCELSLRNNISTE